MARAKGFESCGQQVAARHAGPGLPGIGRYIICRLANSVVGGLSHHETCPGSETKKGSCRSQWVSQSVSLSGAIPLNIATQPRLTLTKNDHGSVMAARAAKLENGHQEGPGGGIIPIPSHHLAAVLAML